MRRGTLFRPAPPRSRGANLLWTAAQSAVIWTLALVAAPAVLLRVEQWAGIPRMHFPGHRTVGAALLIGFSALNVWTGVLLALRGDGTPLPLASPRDLVVAGPYRYVRNPMAIAGIGQGVGIAIWLGSWTVLLYAFAGAVLWQVAVRPAEERDLAARFGGAYEAYRRAVPLWWPRMRRYVSEPS